MHDGRDGGTRRPEVAVALDFPGDHEALAMVERLGDEAGLYKVGLELFTRCGPDVVERLRKGGKRVFLDLKLHDIPTTVERAARAAAALGVELLTVHASGGAEMVRAARAGVEGNGARVLAVTVLTSMGARDLRAAGGATETSVADEVVRLATLAVGAGAHGVVASPAELRVLRSELGSAPLLVTPGIRPAGAERHDQRRVATPEEAVRDGADVLVVGRSVTRAGDPADALARIRATLARAA